jgi:carbon-monoxide dehydrogenase small subunit
MPQDMQAITLKINGKECPIEVKRNWTLLRVLRDVLKLKGTKCGCNTGDCGTCKVIIDGEAVNSCTTLAVKAEGKDIITIEGVSRGNSLHPIQEAFIQAGAVQCGFCTPGMIMTSKALLDKNPTPTREEIAKALGNNLCRCTGYVKIIDAISLASSMIREGKVQGDQKPPSSQIGRLSRGCLWRSVRRSRRGRLGLWNNRFSK